MGMVRGPAGPAAARFTRVIMVTPRRNTVQAFSVRQLKSNPSTVLRAAEADAMALVTNHQQPAALVVALDRLGLPDTAAVRSGLALSLFQSGSLSVSSAAQVAGLPLPRFLEILSSLKIPVVQGSDAELQDELTQARRWLGQAR
jgi:predicted HTH domain antitoxin